MFEGIGGGVICPKLRQPELDAETGIGGGSTTLITCPKSSGIAGGYCVVVSLVNMVLLPKESMSTIVLPHPQQLP
jgi:hypothetical protein